MSINWHEIAWVAARMGNIQGCVEELHLWGQRLSLVQMESDGHFKNNDDDNNVLNNLSCLNYRILLGTVCKMFVIWLKFSNNYYLVLFEEKNH